MWLLWKNKLFPRIFQISKPSTQFLGHTYSASITYFYFKCQMIMQDKQEKERCDAKNAVEEYVYECRDKLSNEFEEFVTEAVS